MTFDKEAFGEWKDHPITEQVFIALRKLAERSKQKWVEQSWDGGNPDPLMLADLRARAEVVNDLCELTYEDMEILSDEEHERHPADRIQGADPAEAA